MIDGTTNIKTRYVTKFSVCVSYIFIIYSHTLSILAAQTLGPTQPPIKWVPGLSRGKAAGKWRGTHIPI